MAIKRRKTKTSESPRGDAVANKGSKDQFNRFVEAARELGCDEDRAHFDEVLKKVARHKPQEPAQSPQTRRKP